MVNIVNESSSDGKYDSLTYDYKETNSELAREVGDLRQQLAIAREEIEDLINRLHQKDVMINDYEVSINELKTELNHLLTFKDYFNKVKDFTHEVTIILKRKESIESEATSRLLALPEPPKKLDRSNIMFNGSLDRISEERLSVSPLEDSLDPPDCTSVPPLVPERLIHTPSIWKCLDSTHAPTSSNNLSSNRKRTRDLTSSPTSSSIAQKELDCSHRIEDVDNQQPQNEVIIQQIVQQSEACQEHATSNVQSRLQPDINIEQSSIITNDGLKTSTNFNSDSPIQPFENKNNRNMFHSTPRTKKQHRKEPLNADDQENLQVLITRQESPEQQEQQQDQRPKPKRQPRARKQPAKRVVAAAEEEHAPRYNLRKRAKV